MSSRSTETTVVKTTLASIIMPVSASRLSKWTYIITSEPCRRVVEAEYISWMAMQQVISGSVLARRDYSRQTDVRRLSSLYHRVYRSPLNVIASCLLLAVRRRHSNGLARRLASELCVLMQWRRDGCWCCCRIVQDLSACRRSACPVF